MRKQFIAKLLALGLVLAMLPTAALARKVDGKPGNSNNYYFDAENNAYYYYTDDVTFIPPVSGSSAEEEKPVEEVKYTITDGVVVLDVEVSADGVATAALTADQLNAIIDQLEPGAPLAIEVPADATAVELTLPGSVLAKMGRDLVIKTSFAIVTTTADSLANITAESVVYAFEDAADGENIVVVVMGDDDAITDTLDISAVAPEEA